MLASIVAKPSEFAAACTSTASADNSVAARRQPPPHHGPVVVQRHRPSSAGARVPSSGGHANARQQRPYIDLSTRLSQTQHRPPNVRPAPTLSQVPLPANAFPLKGRCAPSWHPPPKARPASASAAQLSRPPGATEADRPHDGTMSAGVVAKSSAMALTRPSSSPQLRVVSATPSFADAETLNISGHRLPPRKVHHERPAPQHASAVHAPAVQG